MRSCRVTFVRLIYTSDSTGPHKAVVISDNNFTWRTCCLFWTLFSITDAKINMSFLPLSHVAG